MIQQNVTNRYTEIYIGGGNFITENYPTNFHTFFTRKVLTHGDDISNYREVTPAQKAALEKSDAAWVRAPQLLIDTFMYFANRQIKNYGMFNETTGFFKLGTVRDLTAIDVMMILHTMGAAMKHIPGDAPSGMFSELDIRAVFPMKLSNGALRLSNLNNAFQQCTKIEEIRFTYGLIGECFNTFYNCFKLRVLGLPSSNVVTKSVGNMFKGCYALEELIEAPDFGVNVSFSDSPKLSPASVERIIAANSGTKPIVVTLHPTAYARVTEDMFTLAAEKNITIATTT